MSDYGCSGKSDNSWTSIDTAVDVWAKLFIFTHGRSTIFCQYGLSEFSMDEFSYW